MTKSNTSDRLENSSRRHLIKTIGKGVGAGALLGPFTSFNSSMATKQTGSTLKDPIYYSSASAIGAAIKNKEISSEEITRICLNRIDQINPKINAVVQVAAEQALNSAREADQQLARGHTQGPLHGVPITIKDSFDTAGIISTAGTLGRINHRPEMDAVVVHRLKRAGAIVMGKTNTPELTLAGETDNLVYGRTNNPYHLDRIPGGSSGGAAAIVSAGGSAFDIGTDTGGSIRNPAHCCGLCGIRPTSGRVPRTGHIISYYGYDQALTTAGPLARNVEDLIRILPIISGPDGTDPYIYNVPLGDPNQVRVSELKFAFYIDNGEVKAHQEIHRLINDIVSGLQKESAQIEARSPKILEQTVPLFFEILTIDKGLSVDRILRESGTKEISSLLEWTVESGGDYENMCISPAQFVDHFQKWARFNQTMTSFYQDEDIILCPASSLPAPVHGFDQLAEHTLSYTATYNLTGWPVAVVRIGTADGMPVGIQIVGKPWQEHKVLAVAKFIEDLSGGFHSPEI